MHRNVIFDVDIVEGILNLLALPNHVQPMPPKMAIMSTLDPGLSPNKRKGMHLLIRI